MCPILRRGCLAVLIAAWAGCDSAFAPKGDYKNDMVVFSILSANDSRQYVRLYSTYNPPDYDPGVVTEDAPITDAQVMIVDRSNPGRAYVLRDTTIRRLDSTRYSTPIHAYVTSELKPVSGSSYVLSISSPTRGTATGITVVPGPSNMIVANPTVIKNPLSYPNDAILVMTTISHLTKGYILRFFLEYEYVLNGATVMDWKEVPNELYLLGERSAPSYPRLVRRTSTASQGDLNRELIYFGNQAYRWAKVGIEDQFGKQSLRFVRSIFILTQVEEHLYDYFNIVNRFQDEYSIRNDMPDYSNINGGTGIFGGRTIDTAYVAFDSIF
jgi:hypothetical protein